MATKFQVGDKVIVTRKDKDFKYGFNRDMQKTLDNGGVVQEAYDYDGETAYIVDDFHYAPEELELELVVKKTKTTARSSGNMPVKPAIARAFTQYAVVDDAGNPLDFTSTRAEARRFKKRYGGLQHGVTILKLEATAEVR